MATSMVMSTPVCASSNKGVAMRGKPFTGTPVGPRAAPIKLQKALKAPAQRAAALRVFAIKDGATLDRPLR